MGDAGGDFYIRGGRPTQNQVLVDNLPIVKPFHISNAYSAFPGEMVQSADLHTGGFSAEHMGATSAVLDVTLASGNMKSHEGRVAISPYLVSLQAEGPIDPGQESFSVMGRVSTIEQTAPYISTRAAPFRFYDVLGRYTYQGENYYCNATGLRTADEGQVNPERGLSLSWSNTVLGARCRGIGQMFRQPFDVTVGYSNYQNAERADDGAGQSAGLQQLFFKVNLQNRIGEIPIEYGIDVKLTRYEAVLSERFAATKSFEVPPEVFRAYVASEWTPHRHLTVEPSLGAQFTLNITPTVEPRLRLSYRPGGGDDQELSLAVGRYRQTDAGITNQLDAGTVFTVLKPIALQVAPPKARHGLLRYRQRIGAHFEAQVEGYVKDYENVPVPKWSPVAQPTIETAQASGLAYGADVRVKYERSPLYLTLGYGWSKVTYEAGTNDLGAWVGGRIFRYHPAHDQRHKANVVANYSIGDYTASLRWEFGTGRPYTQVYGFDLDLEVPSERPTRDPGTAKIYFSRPYGKRLPAYHRLDVSVRRTFEITPNLSLKAKVGALNVYDRRNVFYYDLRTLQRVNQAPLLPYVSIQTQID